MILEGLEAKIQQKIEKFGDAGVFIKLNTRSPKDVSFDSTYDQQKVSSLMDLFEGFLREERPDEEQQTLKHQFTNTEVMGAFVKASTASMQVKNGLEAIDLLLESSRVNQDLSKVEEFGLNNATAAIVVRKWNPNVVTRNHMEFRGFVYQNQLNAVSQVNFHEF